MSEVEPIPKKGKPGKKKPRNDAPWRNECIARRGPNCRSCGTTRGVQMDHIVPRSQQGPSIVENGMPLCEPCHRRKTEKRMLVERSWLDDDQVAWLAEIGWVAWDLNGDPFGRGWRGFAPTTKARAT